jgi:hypothetical protein
MMLQRTTVGLCITETDHANPNKQLDFRASRAYIDSRNPEMALLSNTLMESIMKLIVPFDTSISPPKRHWTALWNSSVQPESPKAETNIVHRNTILGDPCALLNPEDQIRVGKSGGFSAWAQHALGAVGKWFARRDEREEEEQLAASEGLHDLHSQMRARDAERSRHFRM